MARGYVDYIVGELAPLGHLRTRRMFGGHGLYCDDVFFGLIAREALYFKADETNRDEYLRRGHGPFVPFAQKPELVLGYYEVPADIIEDPEDFIAWAQRSLAVARRAAVAKAQRRAPRQRRASPKRT